MCFGTGLGARRALRRLPSRVRIIAFTDDDSVKWGRRFHGYPVVAPADLKRLDFDCVLVTTTTYARQAQQRLLGLGIPPEKIRTLPAGALRQDYPTPWRAIRTALNPGAALGAMRRSAGKDSRPTVVLAVPLRVMPVEGGGAARFWSMATFLRAQGFRVVLATLDHAAEPTREIRRRLDCVWTPSTMPAGGRWATAVQIWRQWRKDQATRLIPMPTEEPIVAFGPSFFEQRRNPEFECLAAAACRVEQPLAVIACFAWSAPLFDLLPASVLKILDTIDIQHVRAQRAAEHGATISGFDPPPMRDEEIALLEKADVILAIQAEEQAELRRMTAKPVVLAEHALPAQPQPSPADSQTVLFVGNDFTPNVQGITAFIREAWPAIRARCPRATLAICGKVCETLKSDPENGVQCLGLAPDLAPHYAAAAVVVNPAPFGTGLKIKAVEALAHGKCLVATEEGVRGLSAAVRECARIVPLAEMAPAVAELLASVDARRELERRALNFAAEALAAERVYGELRAALGKHLERAAGAVPKILPCHPIATKEAHS